MRHTCDWTSRPALACRACFSAIAALISIAVLLDAAPAPARARNERFHRPKDAYTYVGSAVAFPVFETRLHYVGQVWFAIANTGLFGTENQDRVSKKDIGPLKIDYSPSFEFPAGSRNEHIYAGGLWVGGIVGADTLVTLPINGESASWVGEFASYDTIVESSSLRGSPFYDPNAKAEQEYYAVYSDTLIIGTTDEVEGRLHKPLHIEVAQRSYAWSDRFSRQFIIVECWIRNIGERPISGLVAGVFVDGDVLNELSGDQQGGTIDDISGFHELYPGIIDPDIQDPIDMAWVADNDGDPLRHRYQATSSNGALGIRILRAFPSRKFSFNWWVGGLSRFNWGPVRSGARPPQAQGGLGSPQGDRNTYYLMTNGEIDYGQLWSNYDLTSIGWRPPLKWSGCDFANGIDTRQILSVGPMCDLLYPGDSVPFVYALCAGNDIHTDPDAVINCYEPYPFYQTLDFSDLIFAGTWASWVYDTPGLDSDGDGYEGEKHRVGGSTIYYTGDLGPPPSPDEVCTIPRGKPDYAGPSAPPCPQPGDDLFVETRRNEIIVRWTGRRSETTPDPLTGEIDFEGYKLYFGSGNSVEQYSLVSTWDRENYQRWIHWGQRWIPDGPILTREDLQELYGDDFDPTLYDRPSTETCFRDSIDYHGFRIERCSYFDPLAENRDNVYDDGGVLRTNPIQKLRDSTIVENGDTLTFGVYETHITGLNSSNTIYVSVTTFDYGNRELKLDPMESLPGTCWEFAVPIYSADVVKDSGLGVSVYPNPYRYSYEDRYGNLTSYFLEGYEAPQKRGTTKGLDPQDRRIWFINLPSDATIRIYTLDGDLVRTLHHQWPRPEGRESVLTDYSSRTAWDLITRNTQAVTSGIYLYYITSSVGTQTGKIVIIK
jgi:hypothetical protein